MSLLKIAMKGIFTSLALIVFLFFIQHSNAQAPVIEWQNTIGGNNNDHAKVVIQTSDGGYLIGGSSESSISGDKTENSNGGWDYWIVKVDNTGAVEWDKTIGGNSEDILESVLQTSDGGYILGGSSNSSISGDKTENSNGLLDYWIVKVNGNGVIEWDKTIGGNSYDQFYSISHASDGGYILGGHSGSSISGDKTENSIGGDDYWIVKISSLGIIIWNKTIGGSSDDFLYSISQTSDGGYILGGYSQSNISRDKTENSWGGDDYWIIKVNSNGIVQWDKTIGGNSYDYLNSISQTTDGGYILGGSSGSSISGDKTENTVGPSDYWIVKVNSNGVIEWENTITGSVADNLQSVSQTSDGGYILGGYSDSSIFGDKTENSYSLDYWILKIDGNGAIEWDKTISGNVVDRLYSVLQTSDGGYILGGYSVSNISEDKTEDSNGLYDFWIVKLESSVANGCTNNLASNYDPLATSDDGSCLYYSQVCSSPFWFDNIDTYSLGNLDAQTASWNGFNYTSSSVDIVNNEAFFFQSIQVENDENIVHDLSIGTGANEIIFNAFVPASGDHGSYFSFLHDHNAIFENTIWGPEVYFESQNSGLSSSLYIGNDVTFFDIPYDAWFEVKTIVDIENNIGLLYINGALINQWTWDIGVDFDFNVVNNSFLDALLLSGYCDSPGCTGLSYFDQFSVCETTLPVGCSDIASCNYDPNAIVNIGCQYPDADGDGIVDCFDPCPNSNSLEAGCTDQFAANFDPAAICNDGSCVYYTETCNTPYYSEGFSSFSAGPIDPQSAEWNGWLGGSSTAEVVIYDFFNTSKSLRVLENESILKDFNINSGVYEIKEMVKVPTNNRGGYFNFFHDYTGVFETNIYAYEVYFTSQQSGQTCWLYADNNYFPINIPYGEWFEVSTIIDITNDIVVFKVNDQIIHSWTWSNGYLYDITPVSSSQIGTMNKYGYCYSDNCIGETYYDDITICETNALQGCTDPFACNFAPDAIVDDGFCDYPDTDGDGILDCYDPCPFSDSVNEGCTDPFAANYDPAAICDISCVYYSETCASPIWSDNFDSYVDGNIDPQSTDWFGWGGINSGADLISYDYSSPFQSVNIEGGDDLVKEFNVNSGSYELKFLMNVSSLNNSGAYFNVLHNYSNNINDVVWAFDVFIASAASGSYSQLKVGQDYYDFIIPYNVWYEVKVDIDIDNNIAILYINNQFIHSWDWDIGSIGNSTTTFGNNQLGAIDLFAFCNGINCIPNALYDDFTLCENPPLAGCTNPLACNYSPNAVYDDGTCDTTDTDGDGIFDCFDVCPDFFNEGCTDPLADNYNPFAVCDNGNCVYFTASCSSPIWEENFDSYTVAEIDAQSPDWFGWGGINSGASVSNIESLSLNNSIHIEGVDDLVTEFNYNSGSYDLKFYTYMTTANNSGGYFNVLHNYSVNFNEVVWAMDVFLSSASSQQPSVLRVGGIDYDFDIPYNSWFEVLISIDIDNDLAVFTVNGNQIHSWPWSIGHDAFANVVSNSQFAALDLFASCNGNNCVPNTYYDDFTLCSTDPLVGCTDPSACNYNSNAISDDGSCLLPDGCTDLVACNYDPLATCDDGSCTFAPCGTCIGDANADGMVNILDLISVSSNFGCSSGCIGNGDANFDGSVDILDLIAVSSNFGGICP